MEGGEGVVWRVVGLDDLEAEDIEQAYAPHLLLLRAATAASAANPQRGRAGGAARRE